MVGWWADVDRLKTVVPGLETMKPVTAACVGLLAACLLLRWSATTRARSLELVMGAVVAALGLATAMEYVLSRSFGVDTILFEAAVRADGGSFPGRMAPMTAILTAMAGSSVVLRLSGQPRAAHIAGVLVALGGGAALAGYAYDVTSLRQAGPYADVALPSAFALAVVGVGLIWAAPEHGLVGLARRSPPAAVLIRGAMPWLVGLPVVLGWLVLQAHREGWYGPQLGIAFTAIGASAIGGIVLGRTASAVAVLDRDRAHALSALASANERLEAQVAARTTALVTREAMGRACLDALEQGVAMSDLEGEVLFLNRAGGALLGYEAHELTELYQAGRWVTYREDGSVMPASERPVRHTMDTGEPTSRASAVWRTKAGRSIVLRLSTEPVVDERGRLAGVVTAFADVTAERASERAAERHLSALTKVAAELEQAVSLKDRFLSTATHDMRSPITTILTYANLLGRDDVEVPGDQRTHMVKAIERQGHRLEALVQDLLSISVIDGGAISLAPQAIDLGPSLRQVAADAGIDVDVVVEGQQPAIAFVDPLRLAQMVTNILQNAARYGRPPITVSVSVERSWAQVRIRDHGDGVEAELVPLLFDRFTTSRRRADADGRGTGLGLAIVRGLAEAHGGDAWYEPGDQPGACFVLRLPTGVPGGSDAPLTAAGGQAR